MRTHLRLTRTVEQEVHLEITHSKPLTEAQKALLMAELDKLPTPKVLASEWLPEGDAEVKSRAHLFEEETVPTEESPRPRFSWLTGEEYDRAQLEE